MSDQHPQEKPANAPLPSPSQIAELTEAAAALKNAGLAQAVDVGMERSGQLSPSDTPGHTFGRR